MIEKIGAVDIAVRRKLVGFGINITDDQGGDVVPDHDLQGIFLKVGDVTSARTGESSSGALVAGSVVDVYSKETLEFLHKSNNKSIKLLVHLNPKLAEMTKAIVMPTIMIPGETGVKARITLIDKSSVEELQELGYFVKLLLDV
jgi:hypothetical protein